MNKKIKDSLTKGLLAGYAGGKVTNVNRGGFDGKASHVELSKTDTYHDEWFVKSHNGGGQELVQVGNEQYTRVYAGGTPTNEQLESLDITSKDIGTYLVQKIQELKGKTRLLEDCKPAPDGYWQYEYAVTGNYPEVEVATGLESITYKDAVVHIHAFILSPVK